MVLLGFIEATSESEGISVGALVIESCHFISWYFRDCFGDATDFEIEFRTD